MISTGSFLDEQSLAKALDISRSMLRQWRMKGIGPAFYRIGRNVRYSMQEVLDWIEQQRVTHTIRRKGDI